MRVMELVSEQLELKADAFTQLVLLRVETSTLKKYLQTIEDEIQTLDAEHVKLKARRAAQHQELSTQVVRATELSSTICSEEMQQRKTTSITNLRSDIQQQSHQYNALDQYLQQLVIKRALVSWRRLEKVQAGLESSVEHLAWSCVSDRFILLHILKTLTDRTPWTRRVHI
ncbi:hypothetical protein SARC_00321 [Sphaeroforma arctica JP610]|uniref:Uncharacterized protein n=1 Tax=Sphaeroforma arctica JP610 TaxID=667725 RepID=A0A0L0GFC0_9EUKA|nr:hypothetical protein SARC_00321 [Sphaeroforma arctica JP610]KNC87556.1 hypothetical protein SARC_00321 [Sphaeroforma arctica JP610]|eukprot:XP_014161458.1 hypothetical protein SARC_00321 [Sphaeroforma arctica JP610]